MKQNVILICYEFKVYLDKKHSFNYKIIIIWKNNQHL